MQTLSQIKAKAARGFTLIELLVVIAIIALLASIILASLNTARAKARDARREADLKEVQNALELYAADHSGVYPVQTQAAANSSTMTTALVSGTTQYIPAIPTDPLSSQTYQYISNSGGTHYCLGGELEGTVPTPTTTCSAVTLPAGTAPAAVNYSVGS